MNTFRFFITFTPLCKPDAEIAPRSLDRAWFRKAIAPNVHGFSLLGLFCSLLPHTRERNTRLKVLAICSWWKDNAFVKIFHGDLDPRDGCR